MIATLEEMEDMKKRAWNAAIEACVERLKKEWYAPDVVIAIIKKEKK